jgi:hypothetical protein
MKTRLLQVGMVMEVSETHKTAKERFNSAHYTQVKVSVKPDIAADFKSACNAAELSMASVLSDFMADYAQRPRKTKPAPNPFATRKLRRHMLGKITQQLEQLLAAEARQHPGEPAKL